MKEALERIANTPDDRAHVLRWLAMDALRSHLDATGAALLRIASMPEDVRADQLRTIARAALGRKSDE